MLSLASLCQSNSELLKELKTVNLERDTPPTERDLGIQWNIEQDNFNTLVVS